MTVAGSLWFEPASDRFRRDLGRSGRPSQAVFAQAQSLQQGYQTVGYPTLCLSDHRNVPNLPLFGGGFPVQMEVRPVYSQYGFRRRNVSKDVEHH